MTYWNDSLLVGVAEIDDWQQKLFKAIDKLMDACGAGKGREEIAQELTLTVSHIKEYFKVDENFQEKYAYPAINAHKRLHAQFMLTVNSLVAEYGRTGPHAALAGKFNRTMVDWLINHISTEDMKVGRHILDGGK